MSEFSPEPDLGWIEIPQCNGLDRLDGPLQFCSDTMRRRKEDTNAYWRLFLWCHPL
jgi:hypothetical protein